MMLQNYECLPLTSARVRMIATSMVQSMLIPRMLQIANQFTVAMFAEAQLYGQLKPEGSAHESSPK